MEWTTVTETIEMTIMTIVIGQNQAHLSSRLGYTAYPHLALASDSD